MVSSYKVLEKQILERLSQKDFQINIHPFPHYIVEDFLPKDVFDQISSPMLTEESLEKDFRTPIEKNKQVYGPGELTGPKLYPVQLLGGDIGKMLVSKIINSRATQSMMDSDNYGGYYPFHSMQSGGYLGSHVDHSHSMSDKNIHIANCIYYASPHWEEEWGGETLLFNKTGFRIIERISPKPNRLIVFLHSSFSFHGANRLNCPEHVNRNTYYMDFYIPPSEYKTVKAHLKKSFGINFLVWRHVTTFVPFAPLGIESFSLKNFISRIGYFRTFLTYLLVYLFRPLGQVLLLYRSTKKR